MGRRSRTPAATVLELRQTSLAGASELDAELVNQAVEEINRLYAVKGMELYLALGEYLVNKFFGGDPDNVDRADDHVTYRALKEHADLRVSHVTLWNSVSVLRQYRLLPSEIRGSLPFAHQRALLSVKDPEAKVELAKAAVAESLTERELKARVRDAKPPTNAGRKADPPFVRKLKALRAAAEGEGNRVVRSHVDAVKPEAFRQLIDQARQDLEDFSALIDKIEALRAADTNET